MRLRLKGLFTVVATIGLIGALGAPASAQGTGGFGAAPAHPNPADPATRAYFKPVIAAGGSLAEQVLVRSTSDQPIRLLVSPVDGLTGTTSGAVYANRQDPVHKAGTWVKPGITSLTLPANGQQLVDFTVNVPATAAPGDHLAGIAFENAKPTSSGGQFGVKEVVRTVVGIQIQVPGTAAPHIRVSGLDLGALPGLHFATLTIHIGDDGKKLVKPNLKVTLAGPSNYQHTLTRRLDTILPGDTIPYPWVWPDDLAAGDYHVTVVATQGAEREVETATLHLGAKLPGTQKKVAASTVPTPMNPMTMVLFAGCVMAVALFVGFRFGARREARHLS